MSWILNDAPPNYQQELAKCQRYFVAMGAIGDVSGQSYGTSNYSAAISAPIPIPMRATPTIVEAAINHIISGDTYLGTADLTLGVFLVTDGNGQVRIRLTLPEGQAWPANKPISALINKLVLSADL